MPLTDDQKERLFTTMGRIEAKQDSMLNILHAHIKDDDQETMLRREDNAAMASRVTRLERIMGGMTLICVIAASSPKAVGVYIKHWFGW